ncbi:MAG: gluconokinase [bacterium]
MSYLGIDIGTTAVKALAVDESARVLARSEVEVSLLSEGSAGREQDPEELWSAVKKAVKQAAAGVSADPVKAMAFSAAMHGLLALDENKEPLTRQITWADGCAEGEARELRETEDARGIYRRTGCPVQALYYPARLRRLRREKPDVFSRAAFFCSVKELFIHRLTGRFMMDRSMASSLGVLNTHEKEWDQKTLEIAGIGPERFPPLVSPLSRIEGISGKAAEETGLPKDVVVVPGAGDGGLANVGSGATAPGQVAATIGTSGAMRLISKQPIIDPEERTWCYYLADDTWYVGGAINSGGIVFRWVRDSLFPDVVNTSKEHGIEPYEILTREAASTPPGADGLIMLPYLMGERTPYWNPDARGVVFGLNTRHTRAHLARAALEGTCFAMANILRVLEPAAETVSEIRASGGFMRSPLWVRILADVLGYPVSIPETQEGSAMGAALFAMLATGRIESIARINELIPAKESITPDPDNHELYKELYEIFAELYPKVEELYNRLGRFREKESS